MIETELGNLRRSHYSDQINSSMDGVEVTVMGWILTVRGHGNISGHCVGCGDELDGRIGIGGRDGP